MSYKNQSKNIKNNIISESEENHRSEENYRGEENYRVEIRETPRGESRGEENYRVEIRETPRGESRREIRETPRGEIRETLRAEEIIIIIFLGILTIMTFDNFKYWISLFTRNYF